MDFFKKIKKKIKKLIFLNIPASCKKVIDNSLGEEGNIQKLLKLENNSGSLIKKLVENEKIIESWCKEGKQKKKLKAAIVKRSKYWYRRFREATNIEELQRSLICAYLLNRRVEFSNKILLIILQFKITIDDKRPFPILVLIFLKKQNLIEKKHLISVLNVILNLLKIKNKNSYPNFKEIVNIAKENFSEEFEKSNNLQKFYEYLKNENENKIETGNKIKNKVSSDKNIIVEPIEEKLPEGEPAKEKPAEEEIAKEKLPEEEIAKEKPAEEEP
ncbi:MAG: hypothetical protein FWC41_11065, partial [Firmicutes bacterium]|nr:hypothetical protein [Bacillota bacterium]